MNSQPEIAKRIMQLFEGVDGVKNVFLSGSISKGVYDEYSDIDIGVDVSGSDNARFTQTIISVLRDNLDTHFHDWATSLLPEKYVIAFYLKRAPLFWYVDITSIATPHVPTLTRDCITNDPLAHFIKLWTIHAKYVLRGGVHENITVLGNRVLGPDYSPDIPPARLLKLTLDGITERADGRFADLISQCWGVCVRDLARL